MKIDINCDMGEGMETDDEIMPYIDSASIACGYHAGDENTILKTIDSAMRHEVNIGAHVSFADREHFGRKEMMLSVDSIYHLVQDQLALFKRLALKTGAMVHHVKPHGALYNQSAKDPQVAAAIARAIKDFDEHLIVYGLSGSKSITEAKNINLATFNEVFADRTYQDDGSLTPRSHRDALIGSEEELQKQVLHLINEKSILSTSGKIVPLQVETICLHGDGPHAVSYAKVIDTLFP